MRFPTFPKLLLPALLFLPSTSHATTGFLKSEETSGMSKICYYDVLGELHTLNVKLTSLCPLTQHFDVLPKRAKHHQERPASGQLGHLKSEMKQGFSKICYYKVLGQRKALTISAVELCPLTYRF